MNVLEQANKYAEGKANEAITKAIADAYIEGYNAGYKDCEKKIPPVPPVGKTEYVDLGLPSHTLWSTDFEKQDDNILYLPYGEAENMNLPTEEQWIELKSSCKWCFEDEQIICLGPNGQTITFKDTGKIETSKIGMNLYFYFWLKDQNDENEKKSVYCYVHFGQVPEITKNFTGYKLPVRLVRN